MRPTLRAVALFAAGVPVAFLIVIHDRSLWVATVAVPLAAAVLVAADALMILPRRRLGVSVEGPRRLPVGDTGAVRVRLALPERSRRTAFTLLLEQAGIADPPSPARADGEGGTAGSRDLAVTLPVRSERRGRVGIEALWLRWRGPLGLVEQRWREALDLTIDVVPIIRGLRSAALTLTAKDAPVGIKTAQEKGDGSEFDMLREHMAGLDNRHIDWKRSARHGKLLSKTFRTERNHPIVLAFDTGHLMLEPVAGKTRLDHAIEAGLLLAYVSLRGGDLVGDFAFDAGVRQFIAPAGGLPHLARLQHGVSRLDYTTAETNFTLAFAELDGRLKRRALVVLFTEFADTVSAELLVESVARIARRHAVIAVTLQDPAMTRLIAAAPAGFDEVARSVIAHDFLRERSIVLERIARLGAHVIDAPAAGMAVALIDKYLLVKSRDQI